jgi:hypothetical protein
LGSDIIWNQQDNHSPTEITSSWKGNANRTIAAGATVRITFQFGESAKSSGYDLTLQFNQDCTVNVSK